MKHWNCVYWGVALVLFIVGLFQFLERLLPFLIIVLLGTSAIFLVLCVQYHLFATTQANPS
jgi:hypothetical protein